MTRHFDDTPYSRKTNPHIQALSDFAKSIYWLRGCIKSGEYSLEKMNFSQIQLYRWTAISTFIKETKSRQYQALDACTDSFINDWIGTTQKTAYTKDNLEWLLDHSKGAFK